MSSSSDELVAALRSAGLRITRQREAICAVIGEGGGHMTVADIHRRAQRDGGVSFDISTVYRTVDALESAGMLHHVHLGHGPSVVHLTEDGQHQHLVCDQCGRTEDISLDDLAGLTDRVAEEFGFIVDGVHFALVGRCAHHVVDSERNRRDPDL